MEISKEEQIVEIESVSSDVKTYGAWKTEIRTVIAEYKQWSRRQKLLSPELEEQLVFLEEYLQQDKIQLAFVGEFSRGKTELINALFFADYGRRLLPSHVGRTTMCPTELFFDEGADAAYLRLLPIDTRIEEHSLQYYLMRPEYWLEEPFDNSDPDQMAAVLNKVTATRAVSREVAADLGFDLNFLQAHGEQEQNLVVIPAWRHALVHFDHPLLRQGLTILDTPGLNALGCEPDLTLSLLPECLAVIFMLNADAGVTSTDLQVWKEYIANLGKTPNAGLFAVLNKIDGVWDDLGNEEQNTQALISLRSLTAQQLDLKERQVLPLSAKWGLLAKVSQNAELFHKSRLGVLQEALTTDVLGHKECCIRERVLQGLLQLIKQNIAALKENRSALEEQKKLFQLNHSQIKGQLGGYIASAKDSQIRYEKQLEVLRRSRDVLVIRKSSLMRTISQEHINRYRSQVKNDLKNSWTSLGMSSAIKNFFSKTKADVQRLSLEVAELELEAQQIYGDYRKLEQAKLDFIAPRFDLAPKLARIDLLREQALASQTRLSSILLSQSKASQRFFNSVVLEIEQLLEEIREELNQWLRAILQPLILHTKGKKRLLEEQVLQCRQLLETGKKKREQLDTLERLVSRSEEKSRELQTFILRIQDPPVLKDVIARQ